MRELGAFKSSRARLMFVRLVVLCAFAVLSLVTATGSAHPAGAQGGALTVEAGESLGTISPFVYGANYAEFGVDLFQLAKDSGINYLRYPHGNWGDENDISEFNVDFYIRQARFLKAEPTISVRLKNGTPEKAAALVKYANITKDYKVHYWAIGNEPNLFRNYTVEQYNKEWRTYALAMRAVDPTIAFLGPEVSQFPPPGDRFVGNFHEWVRSFLKANGDMVDVVTVHRYPFPVDNKNTTIDELRASVGEWDKSIPELRKIAKEATGRDMPVGVTEVNSHWSLTSGGPATPDSFYNGIWWADVLGRLIRQRVMIVAYFELYNDTNYGLLSRYDPRPTYFVYPIYKHLGTELVASDSTEADVSVTAALNADGALTLVVVNLAAEAKSVPLNLSGFTPAGKAQAWRFDADHKAEQVEDADLSAALELPAQSVTAYVVGK